MKNDMETQKPSFFNKRKKRFLKNYEYCLKGAVCFLIAPLALFRSHDAMSRAIGFWSIPLIPLTPLTLAGGVIGVVANTVWGIGALPAAKIKDNHIQKDQNKSDATPTTTTNPELQTSGTTQEIFKAYGVTAATKSEDQLNVATHAISDPAVPEPTVNQDQSYHSRPNVSFRS